LSSFVFSTVEDSVMLYRMVRGMATFPSEV